MSEKAAARWSGLPEQAKESDGHQPRRKPYEGTDVREAFTSEDGGLSYSLFRLPDDCTSPEMLAKHEKTRTAMAKNVAERDKGIRAWKPFGKGQITLKPRTAPKQTKTPVDVVKAWAGEVIHEIACNHCGEFECTCVRDVVSAVLANHGGPVVDADAVARGRQSLTEQTEAERHECADQIAMGEDVPETVVEDVEQAEAFPVDLEPGESVEAYEGEHHRAEEDGFDWSFTTAAGDVYRLWSPSYKQTAGEWCLSRGLHDRGFWWAEIGEGNSLAAAVAWCRGDSASQAWAKDMWDRYGHMNEERVAWSAELVETEIEPNLFRAERYGRVGIYAKYAWGAEHFASGSFAEAGTSGAVDGMYRKRAIHKLTVAGLREIPLDRWIITGMDGTLSTEGTPGVHGKTALECVGSWDEPGLCIGACWNKKAPGRFTADILAEDGVTVMGTVGVCALHLARPLAEAQGHDVRPWDVAYERCGKTKGQWGSSLDWEERYCELVAEMVTAGLDAGEHNPRPDVVAALYAEADAVRAKQEVKTKTSTSTGGESMVGRGSKAPKRTTAVKVGDIVFSGEKGREQAELLGHRYFVRMLAGAYAVEHVGSGERVVEYADAESRPAMKRGILADAVARGVAESVDAGHQERPVAEPAQHLPRPLRLALERDAEEQRQPLTYADLEGKTLGDFTAPGDVADLEELAGPWPVRWLFAPEDGDADRAVNLFAGCGGWCVGVRNVLGMRLDMVCVDTNRDAVATSNAAGCAAICADVTKLDPMHFALRWTSVLIASPPCTDWTPAGKRLGHLPENLAILEEAITRLSFAAGTYYVNEDSEEACEFGCEPGEHWDHTGEPTGDYEDARQFARTMTAETAPLMLEPIIWSLALWRQGAPLHTVALEQSGALPEQVQEDVSAELYCAGWEHVQWAELDAAEYGSPSHRRRMFMLASHYEYRAIGNAPGLTTHASEALDMDPETVIITRANRKTSGGNGFVMGRTVPGMTSKIRAWYKQDDPEFRFTIGQVAKLVTLPEDHPLTGSRTSQCQQAGDIVAPVVSAAVMGTLLGVPWLPSLERYLGELYPAVHGGKDAAETSAQGPAGEPSEIGTDFQDPYELEPVSVFIASARSTPTRRRVLWAMNRADAMRLCSDERTASGNHMLCWTAPKHLGTLGEDWEWTKDRGTTDAVIAELGVTVLGREVLEQAADTAEISQTPAGESVEDSAPADTEENGYGLREGERVRYVGGHESEYAVMLPGDPERYVCGVGADGERMEGPYTFVGPWSHGGKGYSVRFEGKRFITTVSPADILPAIRRHAAKRQPVKAQPTPGLYAPTLQAEERTGEDADACRAGGHRYTWLCVEAEGVSRTLRSYLTCECTGEKLGNFGRSGPSLNQGTQRKPLGIRDASNACALGVAKRNSYTVKGPWEIVSETLKRCPVEWDHAKPLTVAVDPNSARQAVSIARDQADRDAAAEWEGEGGYVEGVETPRLVICGALFMPKVPRTLAKIEKQVRREMAHRTTEQQRKAVWKTVGEHIQEERHRERTADPKPPAVLEGESIQPMNPGWAQEWWMFSDGWGYGFEVSHRNGKWTALARLDEWQSDDGKVSLPGKLVRVAKEPCATAEELLTLCREVGDKRAVNDAATRMVQRVVTQGAEPVEFADVVEIPAVVLPSTGRGYWEIGERVIFEGRAGRVVSATIGKTIVEMDGAEPGHLEHVEPRSLVAELFVVCGTPVTLTVPSRPEPLATPQVPTCVELESYEVPEVPALVICGEPVVLVVPAKPRGWFVPIVAPFPAAEEDGPDYAAISRANRATAVEEQHQGDAPAMDWESLTTELAELRTEARGGAAFDWDDVAAELAALRELTAEGREEVGEPALTWAQVEQELAELRQEAVPAAVPAPVVRTIIPARLARESLSLAASAALVTLTASQLAEVMPAGV
ncbi:DNA cytosine methyltransferase [Streptomyces sp. NPDC058525]|uniref:DNA cytosine methyltransferase n=1 Tax=Streptomyces sp. NPDC058525 TaxID=3346538 RepID=UPI003669F359